MLSFNGVIPDDIGNCTNLQPFTTYKSYVEGTLPSSTVGYLTNLTHLDASGSPYFGGPIPTEIAGMTELHTLLLTQSAMTGIIPSEVGTMSNLRTLALSRTMVSGTIPNEMGLMSSLGALYLGETLLEGTIPCELFASRPSWSWYEIIADCLDVECPCCSICCLENSFGFCPVCGSSYQCNRRPALEVTISGRLFPIVDMFF